eukprot:gnl/TRDRNA2_/TRDRNA2_191391_c0_seq1.p1 gnl/TRDRNA2_/TRDRNA2_191391_c0~~gnl/TRDRNA2_/TRDRNA2_191391_c0_seq1.p1  ORF type:complete len:173 (+),score=39.14 gnl/TRDRNA2_/TRDRNA2_191391_c0_seq1:69-587(+)
MAAGAKPVILAFCAHVVWSLRVYTSSQEVDASPDDLSGQKKLVDAVNIEEQRVAATTTELEKAREELQGLEKWWKEFVTTFRAASTQEDRDRESELHGLQLQKVRLEAQLKVLAAQGYDGTNGGLEYEAAHEKARAEQARAEEEAARAKRQAREAARELNRRVALEYQWATE